MARNIRERFAKYPRWVVWGIVGAIVIFLSGPIFVASIAIYKSIALGSPEHILEAILLSAVSVIGGGISGIVCYFTRGPLLRGYLGKYIYGIILMEAYLWPLTICIMVLDLLGSSQLPDGGDIPLPAFYIALHLYGIGLMSVVWLGMALVGVFKKTDKASFNGTGDKPPSG